MAAKMIRDGILDSARVHGVSVSARWLYLTILLQADDIGLFEVNHFKLGREAGLDQAGLQPLLDELAAQDLIRPYKVGQKTYGFVPRYRQRLRVKRARHPLPPAELMVDDDDAINKINALHDDALTDGGNPPQDAADGGLNLNLNLKKEKDPSLRSGSATTLPEGRAGSPKRKRVRAKTGEPGPSVAAWGAYAAAYQRRYGVEPVRNATVNGQLANFVARVGASEAPAIAAFYVAHRGNLYLAAKHPVDLLLKHAERLRTDWATNQGQDPPRGPGETAFERSRRERVAELSGGTVSRRAPTTEQEVIDVVPHTPRLLG